MAGDDRPPEAAPDEAVPFETPDLYGAYPRLSQAQIAFLAEHGERFRVEPGQVLVREGERCADFLVILNGSIEIVEAHGTPDERALRVHGPGRFLGELGLLQGQVAFYTARVREPGEVLSLPLDRLRVLVARDPILGDLVLRAYLGRRALLVGAGAGFRILGSRYSPDTRRLREFAARNRLPHRWIDLESDEEAEALLRRFSIPPEETPIVIWRDQRVLRNPSNAELARLIGLSSPSIEEARSDLIIVGSGPAGLAAAVYSASEGLTTDLMDTIATGGQAGTSSLIENYFGFPAGISGSDLAERGELQARKFGARVWVPAEATSLKPEEGAYRVTFAERGDVVAHTVVLATGAKYRRLEVPGIERLEGASVYYAATVYEAQQCSADPVAVVGGGNSAGQAVLFLAKRVPRVHLLVRGPDLAAKMSRYLVDQIERHPRVNVILNSEVREAEGDDVLRAIVVENNRTGERRKLVVRAMFVFIGTQPRTAWLADVVALDDRGFVLTGAAAQARASGTVWEGQGRVCLGLETSLPGVFAAGDVRSGSVKRVASAVGEGAMAIHQVHEHLGHTTVDVARHPDDGR
ncbi:FAD-dependent oxidoreductase [Streptomyces hygroscopicus]|uniref:FAD-dependent oxidoreductase n=1 Tax=Streptomyces hygroscopicus TaxID=1912 RepID=UPI000834EEDD|nr:FAD-dependent oxidoreductase [Streptomyces hygroscopicus]GLV73307.1 thioredoxin reductase [Streptomyces hygroscopicus subsp. hygroscopicus]